MWMLLLDLWCPIVLAGYGTVAGVQWLVRPAPVCRAAGGLDNDTMPTMYRA